MDSKCSSLKNQKRDWKMFYSDGKEVVKFAKKQTQESSPQRQRRSRIQVVFLVFLSAHCVFAVRMLWFKKHIQQQEN